MKTKSNPPLPQVLQERPRRLRPEPAMAPQQVLPVVPDRWHGGGGALQEVGGHHAVRLRDEELLRSPLSPCFVEYVIERT